MKILFSAVAIVLGGNLLFAQGIMGTEAQREAGKKLYDAKCAQCHGYDGDAQSVGREFFRPQPRNFTTGIYKFRTTPNGQLPSHADIKRSIKLGMPYTGMPAWPDFGEKELDNLAYYIKTFSSDFEEFGDVAAVEVPKAPPFSEASAERGRIIYAENQCVDCHGDFGRGDGKSAPTLTDHWNEPIRAADLTKPWTFRRGSSREDIFITFTTGLDGSPMPSYNIQPPEDQWALVDYVYSLRMSDRPNYGVMVVARHDDKPIDIAGGKAIFDGTESTRFPLAGQVIEPGRTFFPGVNAIRVNAIYNEESIALMLTWHDMSAETTGHNSPKLPVTETEPADSAATEFSDAVAVLLPSNSPAGVEKPYFMFGDGKNPMDIWFADLAKDSAEFFTGKGSQQIESGSEPLEMFSQFDHGEWTVIFKRARVSANGISFEPGAFVPIAFTVWDGFNKERGNKRGLTSWYHIYLAPTETVSPVLPMLQYGGITFLVLIAIVGLVRMRQKSEIESNGNS